MSLIHFFKPKCVPLEDATKRLADDILLSLELSKSMAQYLVGAIIKEYRDLSRGQQTALKHYIKERDGRYFYMAHDQYGLSVENDR